MKNSILIVLFLILTASVLYGASYINNPAPVNTNHTNPAKLPRLYVDGPNIKRADTGEKIVLKGVSTMAFSYYEPDDQLMSVLSQIDKWGINLLGVYISPKNIQTRLVKLDYVLDWAEKNKIYVYIIPVDEGNDYVDNPDIFVKMMGDLAERYKSRNNVIFGLGAEPNLLWGQWKKYAQLLSEEIVAKKPDALIVMTGTNFGREVDFKDTIAYKNTVYDYHEYPAQNEKDLAEVMKKNGFRFLWEPYQKKYPVIVGEFGGVWENGFGGDIDVLFIQKTLDNINKNGLSYMAYTADNEGQLGLMDWVKNHLTRRGKIFEKDLSDHPPTDFGRNR